MERHRISRWGAAPAALAVALALGGTPASAAGAGTCGLEGTNYYSPRLSGTDGSFSVRSTATFTCLASDAGSIEGQRSAGNVWSDPTTGYKWQEPLGNGTGSCTATTIEATYITRWADGSITVIMQTSLSNTWAITAEGSVIPGVTLTAIDPQEGQPPTLEATTTRFAGHAVSAAEVSHPNPEDPLECTEVGLASAVRSGLYRFVQAP